MEKITYITDINLSEKSGAGIWTYMKNLISHNPGKIIGKGKEKILFKGGKIISPLVGNIKFHKYLLKNKKEVISKNNILHAQRPDFLFWYINTPNKKIVTFHGNPKYILKKKNILSWLIYSYMEIKVLNKINKAIFVDNTTKNEYENKFPQLKNKFKYIPVGVELNKFNLSKKKKDIFLYVGRLSFEKQVDKIIKQYEKYKGSEYLFIIGDGPLRNELEQLAKNDNRIKFLGFVSNDQLSKYYHKSKALIMMSLTEGFPMTVLEALASGVPVISTRVGEIPNIINNKNGKITNDLIEGINHIKKCKSIDCRNSVKNYSWNIIAKKIKEAYN